MDEPTTIGAGWVLLPALAAYLVVLRVRRPRHPWRRLLLVLYALSVVAATVFPIVPRPAAYWTGEPWWTMIHWLPFDVDVPSTVLNVIMFMPFGVLVPLLRARADDLRRMAGWAVTASATIEVVQFVIGVTTGSRRTVDVNDLLANTAGALLGLLILRLAVPGPAVRARLSADGRPGTPPPAEAATVPAPGDTPARRTTAVPAPRSPVTPPR